MNLRSLLVRAALVAAFLGFAFGVATIKPRSAADGGVALTNSAPLILIPFVALPVLHALLSP